MKTAIELYNIYEYKVSEAVTQLGFVRAFAEHDKEIIELIDKMIESHDIGRYKIILPSGIANTVSKTIQSELTELKKEIEGKNEHTK